MCDDDNNNNDKATISLGEKQCHVFEKKREQKHTQKNNQTKKRRQKNVHYKINSRISPKNTSEIRQFERWVKVSFCFKPYYCCAAANLFASC